MASRLLRFLLRALIVVVAFVVVLVALFAYFAYTPRSEVPRLSGTLTKGTITVAGLTRTYSTYVPRELAKGAPLVVVMHGAGENGARIRIETGYAFERLADEHGFAVVYPNAYQGYWDVCTVAGDALRDAFYGECSEEDARWAIDGDRGVTYSATPPDFVAAVRMLAEAAGGIFYTMELIEGETLEAIVAREIKGNFFTLDLERARNAMLNAQIGLFKVRDGIYQLRGFDIANMTLIDGQTGWIVVDPLTSRESAPAALAFAREIERRARRRGSPGTAASGPSRAHPRRSRECRRRAGRFRS